MATNALTVAHISDLHLPFEPHLTAGQRFSKRQLSAWSWRRRRSLQRPEILEALAVDLRAHQPDHIVVTGDVTQFFLPAEFRQAAQWLRALAQPQQISLVPGNHLDALVPVDEAEGLGLWLAWTHGGEGWPYVHQRGGAALIGLNSSLPTAPLLAGGRIGAPQLARLEAMLAAEREAGRIRIVLLHHPVADHAVSARKALADRSELRAVLRRQGAELVLHGHARRAARLDRGPGWAHSLYLCSILIGLAQPDAMKEPRWHRLRLPQAGGPALAQVLVRQWSVAQQAFIDAACYDLALPRSASASHKA